MGGCRCSYRNCEKATNNSDSEFHFFHFPVKDVERCWKWIDNANKPDFKDYSPAKLRNKVVCELHFEQRCFTNTLRKRLVHYAVPTLLGYAPDETKEDLKLQMTSNDQHCTVYSVKSCDSVEHEPSIETYTISQDGHVVPLQDVKPKVHYPASRDDPNSEYIEESMTSNEPCDIAEANDGSFKMPTRQIKVEPRASSPIARKSSPCQPSKVLKAFNKRISMLEYSHQRNREMKTMQMENVQILRKLQKRLPPSLLGLVSLHLYKRNKRYSTLEEEALVQLYRASPTTYAHLIRELNWKLPQGITLNNILRGSDA